jgi:hypothetical protein|tara:strand:- start:11193 stop:11414 length:222 start_codon:yes stop_codon:yes gene_type:complete
MSWYESGEYTGRPSVRVVLDCTLVLTVRGASEANVVVRDRNCWVVFARDRRPRATGAETTRAATQVRIAKRKG